MIGREEWMLIDAVRTFILTGVDAKVISPPILDAGSSSAHFNEDVIVTWERISPEQDADRAGEWFTLELEGTEPLLCGWPLIGDFQIYDVGDSDRWYAILKPCVDPDLLSARYQAHLGIELCACPERLKLMNDLVRSDDEHFSLAKMFWDR